MRLSGKERSIVARLLRRRMLQALLDCPSDIGSDISWYDRIESSCVFGFMLALDYGVFLLLELLLHQKAGLSDGSLVWVLIAGTIGLTLLLYVYLVCFQPCLNRGLSMLVPIQRYCVDAASYIGFMTRTRRHKRIAQGGFSSTLPPSSFSVGGDDDAFSLGGDRGGSSSAAGSSTSVGGVAGQGQSVISMTKTSAISVGAEGSAGGPSVSNNECSSASPRGGYIRRSGAGSGGLLSSSDSFLRYGFHLNDEDAEQGTPMLEKND
jgi:hypothetical protein